VSARHLAIYTGSFDPPTHGHLDVLARARTLFDEIVVGVGRNPDKVELFTPEERVGLLAPLVRQLVATDPSGAACSVDRYSGLTVDFARSRGAVAIIRGIRNVTDLAAECQFAITNRQVAGIETVFVVTGESHAFLSSSLIRQIAGFGGSLDALSRFVPPNVAEAMRVKMEDPRASAGEACAGVAGGLRVQGGSASRQALPRVMRRHRAVVTTKPRSSAACRWWRRMCSRTSRMPGMVSGWCWSATK